MNIVFLGAPGSGKGTQAQKLATNRGLFHLSTGDLLRTAVKNGSPLGQKIRQYLDAGNLVPDDVIIGLIEEQADAGNLSNGFILDGFPRSQAQAEGLDRMLTKHHMHIDHVVLISVDDSVIRQRLLRRAELEGRSDDNEATITHRLKVYRNQTEPLVTYYRDRGLLRTIDGDQTPDDVFAALSAVLRNGTTA